jgi:hypothetical protein
MQEKEVAAEIAARQANMAGTIVTEVVSQREKKIFSDDLLVRIHLVIEMISVDRPCAMGV